MTEVARLARTSIGTLIVWLDRDVERSARAREAREQSARYWDEQASQVVADAKNQLELSRARELAHHYRWRASKIARRQYGDRDQAGVVVKLPEDITSPAGIAAAAGAILRAACAGGMTPGDAQSLGSVLETRRRAIETEDLERRLAALEGKQS